MGINENDFSLWLQIAWNFYNSAIDSGLSDLNPPSVNDKIFDLQKKTAYYTARLSS